MCKVPLIGSFITLKFTVGREASDHDMSLVGSIKLQVSLAEYFEYT